MQEDDTLGPVSYVIVEFPGNKMTGKGLPILLDLVDRGIIRILDLVFVTRLEDGSVRALELQDLGDSEVDLAVFEGAGSGLIDESDLSEASSAISVGSSAAILVFENRWATPFVTQLREGGAELVAAGYIPHDALLASLEARDG